MVSIWPPSRRATLRAEPLPNIRRRTDLKIGRGRREKHRPPRTSSRAGPPSADRASDTRRGLSKPSLRECPNRRREVHSNSEAEAQATLAAAETAPLKQAKAPTAPLAGRAKLPEPRAWRRGAGGEAGGSEQGGAHAQAQRGAARAKI